MMQYYSCISDIQVILNQFVKALAVNWRQGGGKIIKKSGLLYPLFQSSTLSQKLDLDSILQSEHNLHDSFGFFYVDFLCFIG